MKVFCLGNNSLDTDNQTTILAEQSGYKNWGLITNINIEIQDGYYHSSVLDLTPQQIFSLLEKFDLLILLNQPIDQWIHPDAFYLSIKLVDDAESIITVKRLMDDNAINFWEELVETNKSFCIFPFIELLVQNGHTTVCCRSETPITKLKNISNWLNDPSYKEIRDKMLSGELIPDHCSTCYKYEVRGIRSARQQETVEWTNRLGLKTLDDLNKITSPVYYEVRPGNVCNLQCRTCVPGNSNLIEKEYVILGWHDPNTTFEYTGFDFINFDNLKKLYVAGGEPTSMIDLYSFMEKCIAKGNIDFEFLINTNANKISSRFLKLCSYFTNLQFIVSIDGHQKVNDYVRWPSHWDTVINNTKKLNEKHKVSFNVVVSIYTISRLDQLLEFFDKMFPQSLIHCTFAGSDGDMLHPDVFPDKNALIDGLSKIKNLNCYKNDRLLKNFIDGLIDNYKRQTDFCLEKLEKFYEYNDTLDNSRNVKLVDYIPELDKFRTMVLK